MNVEIDDERAFNPTFGLQRSNRDCRVVEDAKSCAMIAMCVVRAAREIDPAARRERTAARAERRSSGTARSLDHRGRPREADSPKRGGRKRALRDGGNVGSRMRIGELGVAYRCRYA